MQSEQNKFYKVEFSFYRNQASRDIESIIELHLSESYNKEDIIARTWISKMTSNIYEAFQVISSEEYRSNLTMEDLMIWVDSLKYYPEFENESNITRHLIDAAQHLFKPK